MKTKNPTRKELWLLLAQDRARRYPKLYAGHFEDALYFASHQYPTRASAQLGCEVLGLLK